MNSAKPVTLKEELRRQRIRRAMHMRYARKNNALRRQNVWRWDERIPVTKADFAVHWARDASYEIVQLLKQIRTNAS